MKKIFVLDTSVLLFDHDSITNFEENDVAIPITVLEELDKFKIGNDTKNFEARAVCRFIDDISINKNLNNWIPLPGDDKGDFKILMHDSSKATAVENTYGNLKNDHKILNAAVVLQEKYPDRKIVLITKDINLRVKAKAIGLPAQDLMKGKVKDVKKIHGGFIEISGIDSNLIRNFYKNGKIEDVDILGDKKVNNEYYILKNGTSSALAFYNPHTLHVEKVEKEYVYNIKPRNAEQAFAIHAILNDNIKLVTLQGVAGTGKTLIALACALERSNQYNQIILARPIIPLSNREIGYLPGDAQEKINPYMQPLFDNLKFIKSQTSSNGKKAKNIDAMLEEGKIEIMPLAFIRGRSLENVIMIIDESQNLTPHEIKTIVTRAGENTKIIFTGDVKQIDTPYLDEQSNGLSFMIDKLKGDPLFANIKLMKGERSALANLANEKL
ncbi:PhoH family protein [Flammeovirga kamogawensis]|uniref:PhoH family protein n=1 Tax=Flammeovirga kamogawensis TaxID=373891 RepID=A0ABX8H1R5_9BACT|nr:PhoH family protein [Flammeovirga kamogawensis]MBB6463619.1 PhoH-like ATPase [Flammeovirga kamogawensis]QWG09841.1 PhoH family protein [Flammeovirga kamogawensis]TRX65348.1 PhoH family protein [Flammeovirga kamogawensis]